jgi:hypothetical protein
MADSSISIFSISNEDSLMAKSPDKPDVIKLADFNGVFRSNKIWSDEIADAPEIHASERAIFQMELARLERSAKTQSPLGLHLTGDAGSGKTHLLSILRQMAQKRGFFFLYADMSTASDFRSKLVEGALESFRYPSADGLTQAGFWVKRALLKVDNDKHPLKLLNVPYKTLKKAVDPIAYLLRRKNPNPIFPRKGVLRAFLLFASNLSNLSTVGYNWLLGILSDEDSRQYDLPIESLAPLNVVKELTWLISQTGGSTVLAVDQIDSLFNGFKDDGQDLNAAVNNFSWDMASLVADTNRCLVAYASLSSTAHIMDAMAQQAALQRFHPAFCLSPLSNASERIA